MPSVGLPQETPLDDSASSSFRVSGSVLSQSSNAVGHSGSGGKAATKYGGKTKKQPSKNIQKSASIQTEHPAFKQGLTHAVSTQMTYRSLAQKLQNLGNNLPKTGSKSRLEEFKINKNSSNVDLSGPKKKYEQIGLEAARKHINTSTTLMQKASVSSGRLKEASSYLANNGKPLYPTKLAGVSTSKHLLPV